MCGSCGPRSAEDWASPLLASLSSRRAAGSVVSAACARPARIRAVPGGWTVHRPTGAVVVVATLTELVDTVTPSADAAVDPVAAPAVDVTGLPHRLPVTLAHGAGAMPAIDSRAYGWQQRLMARRSPVTLLSPDDPEQTLRQLLRDPLRRHVRVADLLSPSLPGWGPPRQPLPDLPEEVPAAHLAWLTALLAVRLRGQTAGNRTRTTLAVDGHALTLDALGRQVLGLSLEPSCTPPM